MGQEFMKVREVLMSSHTFLFDLVQTRRGTKRSFSTPQMTLRGHGV